MYSISIFYFIFYLRTQRTPPPAYGPELNSPKTEFLLIGLSKQLAKINNSSLTTTHSARNLGFISDEHLTFSDQISSSDLSPNLANIIFVSFAVSVHTSIQKTASTIATSTVRSKLDYCNSLYHNLPKSQITRLQQSRTLLHVLLSKLPNSVTSLPSSGLCTG